MAGEKSATVFLEKRPDLLVIRLRDVELRDFGCGKKLEFALLARRRELVEAWLDFKKENERELLLDRS